MDVKRILNNDLSLLVARSNEGKTQTIINLIKDYQKQFKGDIWAFGLKDELVTKLNIKPFYSLLELEQITNSIIIIDEVGLLFDLDNRKNKKQIDLTFRMVNHNGNKMLLSGLPTDFKKYICAKAKCFMLKTLQISDLINGSQLKEIVMQHKGKEKGTYLINVDKNKILCYDGHYWRESIKYYPELDTKSQNKDLFCTKKRT